MSQDTTTMMRLLNKDVLRANLQKAGLYALAYEMLKNSLIEKPKGFFTMGGSTGPSDLYKTEVLSKHPNPLIASCLWFEANGAISEAERKDVLVLREHRNFIAHELPNVLLNPVVQVDEEKLIRLVQLLCKVDRWWFMEIEMSLNPDFDGQDIDPKEVSSGSMEFVSHVMRVVYDLDDSTNMPKPA